MGNERRIWNLSWWAVLWAAAGVRPAFGHIFTITNVVAVLKADGTYVVDVRVDVDALALGVSPTIDSIELVKWLRALSPQELADGIEHAEDTLSRRVRIRFDGVKQEPIITFPEHGTALATEAEPPTVLGTTARLTGRIPRGAREFTFRASRAFNAVHLTVLDEASAGGAKYALGASEESPPYVLGTAPRADTREAVAARYGVLGFEHILPLGLDHILFVCGLFLLSTRLRPLLWQVTAFTIAHSVTLALSMYGVVSLPPRIVETLIALSIAYVAVENVLTAELKPWRPAVVFCFGLLHGLGFARALHDLGLPRSEFVTGLVAFNVGVELGQMSVVLLAFAAIGWLRHRPFYRRGIVIPLSLLIAGVGLYWAVTRAVWGV